MLLCHIIQFLRFEINLILYKQLSTTVPKFDFIIIILDFQ